MQIQRHQSVTNHKSCDYDEGQAKQLTAYQRLLMKDVAEMSIAIPHSHAMTPARLFTPWLGQSKTSSTHLHSTTLIRADNINPKSVINKHRGASDCCHAGIMKTLTAIS